MLNCLKWNCFCILNWVVWHWICVLMLNWTVWKRTVYMYKNGFGINNLDWCAIKANQTFVFNLLAVSISLCIEQWLDKWEKCRILGGYYKSK